MEITVKGSEKEIADFVLILQSQQKAQEAFIPSDSNGHHPSTGIKTSNPLSEN